MKKLLFLSLISVSTIALVSCDGFEKKIDKDDANEIIEVATEKSEARIKELSKGNVAGFNFNANFNLSAKNSQEYYEELQKNDNQKIVENEISINGNGELKANLDYVNLNQSNLAGSEIYLYGKLSSTEKEQTDVDDICLYLNGKNLYSVYPSDTDSTVNTQTLADEEANSIAEVLALTLKPEELMKYISEISGSVVKPDPNQPIENPYSETMELVEGFFNDTVTAQQLVDHIDEEFFGGEMFTYALEGTEPFIVKTLDRFEDISPANYFDYTKVSNKSGTTLYSKFNYEKWALASKDSLKEVKNELVAEKESLAFYNIVEELIEVYLPKKIQYDFGLSINKEGIISGMSLAFAVAGHGTREDLNLAKDMADEEIKSFSYDISANLSFSFDITSEKVSIDKTYIDL